MAIYHLTTKIVARSKGHSAVAAAAYRARTEITNERTGEVWDYSRKSGDVLFAGIYLPKDAPEWMQDRAQLWNAVEFSERRKDAQVARDFIIGLPHELTDEQQRYALQDWVRENFVRKGYVADVAIHRPGEEGDQRNTHAHVLVTMRPVEGEQFAVKKERSADRLADLEQWRESWEKIGNRHLARHGHAASLDRRTLEEQGIDREAQIHVGKDATEMERKGKQTDRGDLMNEIQLENLARELKKKFGHEVTVNELQKAQSVVSEPASTATVEPQPESDPEEPPQRERRAPRGQGIMATIWSFARNSAALFADLVFGRGQGSRPLENDVSRQEGEPLPVQASEVPMQSEEAQQTNRPRPMDVLFERSGIASTEPPPSLTRELTGVEKIQERLKQDLAQENLRPDRERRRIQELELDF